MLKGLQEQDPEIDHVVMHSKFVVHYLLHQDDPNPGWKKAGIEGPVFLVRRRARPRYQIIVKNQFSSNDLIDGLHPDWELDCQKNYVFFKIEDPAQRIRALWFHDDAERQKLEAAIEKVLNELRKDPQGALGGTIPEAPGMGGMPQQVGMGGPMMGAPGGQMIPQGQMGPPGGGQAIVTKDSLRAALHALADDQNFLEAMMAKLREQQF